MLIQQSKLDIRKLEYGQDNDDKSYISIQDVELSELCIEDYRNEDGLEYHDLYIDEVDADLSKNQEVVIHNLL